MAALALSGDWAAEFVSGSDSAATNALGEAADADWTREFIAEAAGNPSLSHSGFSCNAGCAIQLSVLSSVCHMSSVFNWSAVIKSGTH